MKINPRRPLGFPAGHMESDRAFIANNMKAAVELLERELAKKAKPVGFNPDDTTQDQ